MYLSISRLKAFKSCRRMFELRYVEGLEPVHASSALEIGSNYHELLEYLNKNGELPEDAEHTKELAMAIAYQKYIYPRFKVVDAEVKLTKPITDDVVFFGIVDGIAEDGHIVEHKSYGSEITEEYEYNLLWDEQILAYMWLTDTRAVWYTICRKPTIRQKKDETDEQFFERMVAWYDEDTESKIRLLEITRTDDEVEEWRKGMFEMWAEIRDCKNYYKNTCHCNVWGRRCEYSSICLNYNPDADYIEFAKRET